MGLSEFAVDFMGIIGGQPVHAAPCDDEHASNILPPGTHVDAL